MSKDDEVRAGIIQNCIRRAGFKTSHAQDVETHEGPAKKQRTMQETETAACAAGTVPSGMQYSRLQDFPCQDVAFECEQQGIQYHTECIAPWTVQDSVPLASSLQEFALSPLETEVLWLREALAMSTKREESSLQMCKELRIQLHKAYRMIALHHLTTFT